MPNRVKSTHRADAGRPASRQIYRRKNVDGVRLVSQTRNVFLYRHLPGQDIFGCASGMGCPPSAFILTSSTTISASIPLSGSGNLRSLQTDDQPHDLIPTLKWRTANRPMPCAFDYRNNNIPARAVPTASSTRTAEEPKVPLRTGPCIPAMPSTRQTQALPEIVIEHGAWLRRWKLCPVCQRPVFGRTAAALLTVSDNIITHAHECGKTGKKPWTG